MQIENHMMKHNLHEMKQKSRSNKKLIKTNLKLELIKSMQREDRGVEALMEIHSFIMFFLFERQLVEMGHDA